MLKTSSHICHLYAPSVCILELGRCTDIYFKLEVEAFSAACGQYRGNQPCDGIRGARGVWRMRFRRDALTIMSGSKSESANENIKVQLDEAIRLFALKKYERAADAFSNVLEDMYV